MSAVQSRVVRTDAWPRLTHLCVDGINHDLRFSGRTPRVGATEFCARCITQFVYVRRAAPRPTAAGGSGMTHF